jgi:invasion protein IalB
MPASRVVSRVGKPTRKMTAAVLVGTAIAAASQSALAQVPEEGSPAWRVECSGDGKSLECSAIQQAFNRETRQLVVALTARPTTDGKTGTLMITLPLGIDLAAPVMVKADNGVVERSPVQTCTNVGCFVAMMLTEKSIAAMRTGAELKITVQDANKKPIEMKLPLLGFGLAFDKAK